MHWKEEEIKYLENNWGTVSVKHMAKKFNRSESAVTTKAKRLGLGACYNASGHYNANDISNMLKVDTHTVIDFWIKKQGLKSRRKKLIKEEQWFVKQEDLLQWLQENTDKWDSRKVALFALGTEPEWLKRKREKDKHIPNNRFKRWTREEDSLLISYTKIGKTQKEIGQALNRSRTAIQRRLSRLKANGFYHKEKIIVPWTLREEQMLFEMDAQGIKDDNIAWKLGREAEHIRDHRRYLKRSGKYPYKHKIDFTIASQTKEIIKLKKKGRTHKEIANKFNMHPSTVYRRLKSIEY